MTDAVDAREISADIADLRAAHATLVGHLRSLAPLDPTTPSQLPGWSVGHVLTHLARNADSQHPMLAGRPQYRRGREGRDADIDAGAGRPWGDLVADVERTGSDVDAAFERVTDWSGTVEMLAASRPRAMLPFLRLREVVVHHTDLGLGFGFDHVPARYLRKELRLMEMLWRANKPMGMTPLPAAALAAPATVRLAWLMGRADIDGLAPAAVF